MTHEDAQLRTLKQQLLDIAETAIDSSLLLQTGFQLRHPDLFAEATRVFGTWESALAELVMLMRDKEAFLNPEDPPLYQEEDGEYTMPDRDRAPEADEPLPAITSSGELVVLAGTDIPLTDNPITLPLPESCGHLGHLSHQGKSADLMLFSQTGLYFGMIHDFLPGINDLASGSSLRQRFDMPEDDKIITVLSRNQFNQTFNQAEHRFYHVTRQGKAKASELKEYNQQFGRGGREAFMCKDDDVPVSVMIGNVFEGLFCASALGQGIHLGTKDIRSMGRKSVGVNVMKLAAPDDEVVSAFLTEGVNEVAVLTQEGFGKRIDFREFRRQGRGGAGMQVLRLPGQDRVVGVVPVKEDSDLVLATSHNRIWRFPAGMLSFMGRPARGKRIFDTQAGETITLLAVLPCAGNRAITAEEQVDIETEQVDTPDTP